MSEDQAKPLQAREREKLLRELARLTWTEEVPRSWRALTDDQLRTRVEWWRGRDSAPPEGVA